MKKYNLNNIETLEKLFEVWKKANMEDENTGNNFPRNPDNGNEPPYDFKDSFTYDGFLSNENKADILFIAREPNVSEKGEINEAVTNEYFWMRDVVEKKAANIGRIGRNGTVYYNYLNEIAANFDTNIEFCAYMNINKRGGYGKCTFDRLNTYFDDYKNFILKEIELINPKRIVLLGYGKYEYVNKLRGLLKAKEIYQVYHPSCPQKYKTLCCTLKR